MLEFRRAYLCTKCKHVNIINAEYEQFYIFATPTRCKNPEDECRSTNFAAVTTVEHKNYKDYQEIKIQEQMAKLKVGTIPRSMWVTLEDDLAGSVKPGDDIVVW